MAAMDKHQIPFTDEDYVSGRFSYDHGYRAAETLIQRGKRHSAIFCMADVMALGAIRCLSDHGYQVPQDVSVVGYDGLSIGAYMIPRLSTVGQNVADLAQRSVELLKQGINGGSAVHEMIPAQMLMRESVRTL